MVTPEFFCRFDSLGVTEEAIQEFCKALNLGFDRDGFQVEMERVKRVFRDEVAKRLLSSQENLFIKKIESLLSLYNPKVAGGVFQANFSLKEDPTVQIEWVFDEDGDPAEELSPDESSYWIVLNRTPFFPGTSAIVADIGTIKLETECEVSVTDVKQLPSGWILHLIRVKAGNSNLSNTKALCFIKFFSRLVGRS